MMFKSTIVLLASFLTIPAVEAKCDEYTHIKFEVDPKLLTKSPECCSFGFDTIRLCKAIQKDPSKFSFSNMCVKDGKDADTCIAGNGNDTLLGGSDDDKCASLVSGEPTCFEDGNGAFTVAFIPTSWEEAAKNAVESAKKALSYGGGGKNEIKFHISCS